VLAVAATCVAVAFQAGSASANVVTCTPITDYSPGGATLTAAYVNPATVPENAQAADALNNQCDVGIYYNDGAAHSLSDTHVFGARYYGILVRNPGTTLTFSHGSVYDSGENPPNGAQHGVDVAFRDGGAGQVDHSQIYDYQKGGIVVAGTGSSAQVLSNTVRGLGPVPFIAQNGVQYSDRATGTVNDNFIEDNQYTGCSKADQKATGCTYVVSTGILLVNVDPTLVNTKNNTYRNNDVNILNAANSP
jgi:hypothetical protein